MDLCILYREEMDPPLGPLRRTPKGLLDPIPIAPDSIDPGLCSSCKGLLCEFATSMKQTPPSLNQAL